MRTECSSSWGGSHTWSWDEYIQLWSCFLKGLLLPMKKHDCSWKIIWRVLDNSILESYLMTSILLIIKSPVGPLTQWTYQSVQFDHDRINASFEMSSLVSENWWWVPHFVESYHSQWDHESVYINKSLVVYWLLKGGWYFHLGETIWYIWLV